MVVESMRNYSRYVVAGEIALLPRWKYWIVGIVVSVLIALPIAISQFSSFPRQSHSFKVSDIMTYQIGTGWNVTNVVFFVTNTGTAPGAPVCQLVVNAHHFGIHFPTSHVARAQTFHQSFPAGQHQILSAVIYTSGGIYTTFVGRSNTPRRDLIIRCS